eukprot:g35913.t1
MLSGIDLSVNVSKMKEPVIDFRKWSGGHSPICINIAEVEMVDKVKFLGVMITNNLSWSAHIDSRCAIESIPSGCITAQFSNCYSKDRKKPQRVVNTAQSIMQVSLPTIDFSYTRTGYTLTPSSVRQKERQTNNLKQRVKTGRRMSDDE